jgi:Flp pilus assembly protein TadG
VLQGPADPLDVGTRLTDAGRRGGRIHGERGAAAVEFAIVASVLVMLIFGVLEFGLDFWQVQNLRAATREGARAAAVRATPTQVSDALVNASSGSLPAGFVGFTMSPASGCTPQTVGQEVTVTIQNATLPASVRDAFTINIPFMPTFTTDPTLSGTFRCE